MIHYNPDKPHILVDADACPVKDEIYKVALRKQVPVTLVSNSHLRIPPHPLLRHITVSDGFDAADDWIADRSTPMSIVITADILLAERTLKAGAITMGGNGKLFRYRNTGHYGRFAGRYRPTKYWRSGTIWQSRPVAVFVRARRSARQT